jgi:REP-associated tyrosine transposase
MPRTARVVIPNLPHHIVQRGHNRNSVFLEEADYAYYLETLRCWKRELDILVYAWCLMTNHVHLILRPGGDASVVGKLMKRLAGRQTRYFNKRECRTGTLWEGRFKSSPIQTDQYLLHCCRYVELNPVKAGMLKRAEDYPWSSFRHKVGLGGSSLLDFDPCYQSMSAPEQSYREFVEKGISDDEQCFIHDCVQRNGLTGGSAFVDEIELRTGLRIEHRLPGRPAKLPK